jgi:hypothetical protein
VYFSISVFISDAHVLDNPKPKVILSSGGTITILFPLLKLKISRLSELNLSADLFMIGP